MIFEAISSGDGDGAERLVRGHLGELPMLVGKLVGKLVERPGDRCGLPPGQVVR